MNSANAAIDSGAIYDDTPDMDTLGGRLSRAREAAGLSAAQLARRVGVKTETLSAWESDRSEPRANHLTRLAGVLNVSLSWILFGIGNAPADDLRSDLVRMVSGHLDKMKRLRDETGLVIERLEQELERFSRLD